MYNFLCLLFVVAVGVEPDYLQLIRLVLIPVKLRHYQYFHRLIRTVYELWLNL